MFNVGNMGYTLIVVCCVGITFAAMAQVGKSPSLTATSAVVRYQVRDVDKSLDFYTKQLGFKLVQQTPQVFAMVSRGDLVLLLSGPGSSGARPMPDGTQQKPGGWNRIVLYVDNLETHIERLKKAQAHFRNNIESGPGGTQILIDDPEGNPIELHEAPKSK